MCLIFSVPYTVVQEGRDSAGQPLERGQPYEAWRSRAEGSRADRHSACPHLHICTFDDTAAVAVRERQIASFAHIAQSLSDGQGYVHTRPAQERGGQVTRQSGYRIASHRHRPSCTAPSHRDCTPPHDRKRRWRRRQSLGLRRRCDNEMRHDRAGPNGRRRA